MHFIRARNAAHGHTDLKKTLLMVAQAVANARPA
jgi:hypothetical protein